MNVGCSTPPDSSSMRIKIYKNVVFQIVSVLHMLFPGNQFEEMQLMRSPNLPEHHGFNIGPTRSICRITAMKSADMAPTRIGVFLQCRKNEYYWLCNYGVKNSYTLYFYGIVVQYKHNWYNSGHNCACFPRIGYLRVHHGASSAS